MSSNKYALIKKVAQIEYMNKVAVCYDKVTLDFWKTNSVYVSLCIEKIIL